MKVFNMVLRVLEVLALCGGVSILLTITTIWWQEHREKIKDKHRNRIYGKTVREVGSDIFHLSHWFSESPEALTALHALSQHMMRHGNIDMGTIREDWYKLTGAKK